MKKRICAVLITTASVGYTTTTMAELGVTDACQEDVSELRDKIKDNKDDYTAESRRKAKLELTAANTNRLNPAKCRKNILDARAALTQGKQDKKRED